MTQTTLDRTYEAELWRLKGELLLRSASPDGDTAEAERCLLRALEIARIGQARALELRAAASVARAWAALGRETDARAVLDETLRWFDGRAETPDLLGARGLFAQLTAH